MKLILPIGVAFFSLVVSGATASAQTLQVPRVEVGFQGGLLGAIAECFCPLPTLGPRVTFNISQQNAIELSVVTLVPSDPAAYGLYFLEFRRTTRRPSSWMGIRPFYTAGTGGYYRHRHIPERRSTRPDGSVVIYPRHSEGELSRLNIASFGGGVERGLHRYASLRLEGSGFVVLDSDDGFLAYRALAGISIPIGGYGAATIK